LSTSQEAAAPATTREPPIHKFRNYGFKTSVIKKRTMDYSTVPFLLF